MWTKQIHIPPLNPVIHTKNETCWQKKILFVSWVLWLLPRNIAHTQNDYQEKSHLSIFIYCHLPCAPNFFPIPVVLSLLLHWALLSGLHWNKQGIPRCGQLWGQAPQVAGMLRQGRPFTHYVHGLKKKVKSGSAQTLTKDSSIRKHNSHLL